MATEAQINANRRNADHSTGPRTQEGRQASARNAITSGLYTFNDFVLPDEAEIYDLFCKRFEESCTAGDAIEQCLAAEITSAAWRLRRCNLADGDLASHSTLDPLLDTMLVKEIRSIERARAHSTSVFHRGLNQLKKLQKERFKLEPKETTPEPEPALRPEFLQRVQQKLDSIMNEPEPDWDEIDRQIAENKQTETELASDCKTPGHAATATTPARTRLCPCKSGKKYKHCCGKNTPWQSQGAA